MMNKKPGLLFVVCLLAIIVLAVSFNMNFGGNEPIHLRAGIDPNNVLYVCPVDKDGALAQLASGLRIIGQYAYLLFAFMALVLVFSWGWALYQNLLKDKFSVDVYKNPWDLTKVLFWMSVVFYVLFMTPDHFRRVEVRGRGTNWVLCDNTTTGAKAIFPEDVTLP
jgi:hypothetical protein